MDKCVGNVEILVVKLLAICQSIKLFIGLFLNTGPHMAGCDKTLLLQFSFDFNKKIMATILLMADPAVKCRGDLPNIKTNISRF